MIGSGYGGSITAARLADAGNKVCILERGKEWLVGEFPDDFKGMLKSIRSKRNPLGLVDYYACKDIDVMKGNGLGGGSLINLNVAFRPDQEYFAGKQWPKVYRDLADSNEIWKYYDRAESVLLPNRHPRGMQLTKVKMMKKRADQLKDAKFERTNITVNFKQLLDLAPLNNRSNLRQSDR